MKKRDNLKYFDMKELIKRSLEAIKKRGLIDKNTTDIDFYEKMYEELIEFNEERILGNIENMIEECIDLITVGIMFIEIMGYDFIEEFEKVVIKNEKRAEKNK
ncbi:MAG: hypothetical protein ACFFD2_12205 [Promethearchaeota archaeon]